METLALRGLTFTYPDQSSPALENVTLTVEQGDFWVLCGPSGCGKSTLLRQCKTVLTPHGRRSGEIRFQGKPLDGYDQRRQARSIGFVQQSPDNQLVTDKVWHELAFGLESLGCDTPTIRRKVAEMASFFGIQNWFYKNVSDLSGGQKQLLNLAAVMTLDPSLLILDEPTSQLDPIAAADFLAVLSKLNRELGTTVLLTEHRLEEALPLANRVAVMDKGTVLAVGTPQEIGQALKERSHPMFLAMPTPMRVWAAVKDDHAPPTTVREGRDWLAQYAAVHPLQPLPEASSHACCLETAVSCKELSFRYEKDGPEVVNGLSLEIKKGELFALLGGNGTGKTTLLKLLAGLEKPSRGKLRVNGSLGVLPQDPQALFVKKTVREDLLELCGDGAKAARAASLCRLDGLLDRHPFDLSGGEQQRAALAKILLLAPDILLLDEPTKGLDAQFKQVFAGILEALLASGATIVMVSHDIEFCAAYAHRCALMFNGAIVTEGPPRPFFSGNSFYTTAANRMGRALVPQAVTAADLIAVCGGAADAPSPLPRDASLLPPPPAENASAPQPSKLPWWRKLLALLSGAVAAALLLQFMGVVDLSGLLAAVGLTNRAARRLWLQGVFCAALLICAFCVTRRSARPSFPAEPPPQQRRLARRTVIGAALSLLLVPLTLFVGEYYLGGGKYYFIMLLILLECMLPFFLVFEGRKPQARELVIIAVLCAIGVAGRAALIMLPQFKPAVAITIISGVAFGGETGFLVGAVTMLASNVLLGQGPYTPWQMFAAGIIGFLAGVLYRKGLLRRTRLSLCLFGSLATLLLYGGVMNFQSALQASPDRLNVKVVLAYCASGFPMDCVHAAATWFFLWIAAEPMLEKLDRIKVKYGLLA